MRINSENIIVFIFILMIAVIGYQQLQIRSIKHDLSKEYTRQIDSIGQDLILVKHRYLTMAYSLEQMKKKDSIQDRLIYNVKKKVKKYEKVTNYTNLIKLSKDSIRAILTE